MDVRINDLKRPEWERLCDASHASLQQRWAYGETIQRLGGTILRLSIHDNQKVVAIAQIVRRRLLVPMALLSLGPVWVGGGSCDQRNRTYLALRRALRRAGIRCLLLTASTAAPVPFGQTIMTPASTARLVLCPTMRNSLHGKWRNRLVKAESSGLRLTNLTKSGAQHDWLIDKERRQRCDRGYKSLPHAFTHAWMQAPTARFLTVMASQHDPVAGMMFLRHGNTATYHIGWAGEDGRRVLAHNLMLWSAMEQLLADGVETLDLGLLDTERTPGLARFKLGTGAEPHRLGATVLSF